MHTPTGVCVRVCNSVYMLIFYAFKGIHIYIHAHIYMRLFVVYILCVRGTFETLFIDVCVSFICYINVCMYVCMCRSR